MTRKLSKQQNNQYSEVAALQQLALEYASQSKSNNTNAAYQSDWADFENWAGNQWIPTKPASPEAVALYITFLAKNKLKVSTIQRRLVAISQKHKASGYESPTKAQIVRATMQGIRRVHGIKEDGKAPILTDHLNSWVGMLSDSNMDKRDKSIVLMGYAGAFRRSELVALNRDDVEITPYGLIVTIRKSKTDQEGIGRAIGIPYGMADKQGNPSSTCPVTAYLEWIEAAGIQKGPLFLSIKRGDHIQSQRLDAKSVSIIVKKLCEKIGLNPDLFGAHSLRAGHITQAKSNGADEEITMRQSGHKSLSVFRGYIRDDGLFENNSAGKLGL